MLAAAPLAAQDTAFSLPTPTASPAPRMQGPVDGDNPVFAPRVEPLPSASPSPSPSSAPAAAPTAAPSAPSATATPRPAPRRTPTPAPSASLPPDTPVSSEDAPPAADAPAAFPVGAEPAVAAPQPAPAEAAPIPSGFDGRIGAALAAALALLAVLWLALRRRARRHDLGQPEDAELPEAPPAPQPETPPPPPAAPAPPPAPLPEPAFAQAAVALDFAPRRMAATLVNAALDYTVTVTNTGATTIELIALAGDMMGAHAALKAEDVGAGEGLPVLHRVPRLAAGESAALSGTIRLPLAQIVPIAHGAAQLFVPLVRLSLRAVSHDGEALALAETLVVGEPPQAAGGGLRPFRLDLGPRIYADLSARKVSAGG